MVNTFTSNLDANQSNNVVVFAEKASRNTTRRFGATVDSGTIKEVPEQYGSSRVVAYEVIAQDVHVVNSQTAGQVYTSQHYEE